VDRVWEGPAFFVPVLLPLFLGELAAVFFLLVDFAVVLLAAMYVDPTS
jgi:hypothetical protein